MTDDVALETTVPWRVGSKVGRTIYACFGDGVLIGVMDSPEIAAHVVEAHNASLESEDS